MPSSRISRLLALIALASSVLPLAALAARADEAPKRSISLTATGAIRTAPDKVDITTGVTSQAPSAKEALAKNSTAMTEVIAALKAEGLDAKDIQTTNFTVQPLYEERKDGRSPKIVGYQVTNSVHLTVRDIGKLGQILDRVVTLGANDVNSIDFGVAEPEALKDEARKLAMRNAIANAKLYAEAAGAKTRQGALHQRGPGRHRRPLCIARAHGDVRQGGSHRGRNGNGRGARQRHLRAGVDWRPRRDLIQIKAEPSAYPLVLSA